MEFANWTSKLNFGGHVYTLVSCDYCSGNHYWLKFIQSDNIFSNKGSFTFAWLHNNLKIMALHNKSTKCQF